MPTISKRQLLIQEILQAADDLEQISHISRMALDYTVHGQGQALLARPS